MATKKHNPITDKEQLTAIAAELLKKGSTNQHITKHLHQLSQDQFPTEEIETIIADAFKIIHEDYPNLSAEVKLLHIKRLDRIIARLMATEELDKSLIDKGKISHKQWLESRNKKIKAYDECLNTMKQKEDLMQLIDATTTVDIDEKININVTEKKSAINLDKLTFEEQVELLDYIKILEAGENQPQSVIEVTSEGMQITEDIVAEVLPANIEQIAQTVLLPAAPGQAQVSDPIAKIRERLRIVAAQTFKDAGGKLDEGEQGLLENKK